MMSSAQVVKTSVATYNNIPSNNYPHLEDQSTQSTVNPPTGFKPITTELQSTMAKQRLRTHLLDDVCYIYNQ